MRGARRPPCAVGVFREGFDGRDPVQTRSGSGQPSMDGNTFGPVRVIHVVIRLKGPVEPAFPDGLPLREQGLRLHPFRPKYRQRLRGDFGIA